MDRNHVGTRAARCAYLGAAVLAVTATARGQEVSLKDAVQLSLQSNVLSYQSSKYSSDTGDSSRTDTGLSFLSAGAGVGVAYGIEDDIFLGGRMQLATMKTDSDGGSSTRTTTFSIAPTFEYMFSNGMARPFVGAFAGYQMIKTQQGSADLTVNAFSGGPVAGVHLFAADGFSIDPSVTLSYTAGSASVGDASLGMQGLGVGVGVAFSGWPGARRNVPAAAAATAAVATPGPSPSSTKAAAPTDRVSAATVQENRGVVTLMFALIQPGRETKAVLSGQPSKDPHSLELTLIRTVPIQEAVPACSGMALAFGAQTYALTGLTQRPGDTGTLLKTVYDQGHLDAQVIQALGMTHASAKLLVCGRSWELSAEFVEKVYEFDGVFRSRVSAPAVAK